MKNQPQSLDTVSRTGLSALQLERICYRLGSSLKSGIPIPDAWRNESSLLRGKTRQSFDKVHSRLLAGDALADALLAEPCLPPLLTEMVRVGEETGQLDQTFLKMADHYRALVRMKRTFLQGVTWPVLHLITATAVISVFFVVLHVLQSRIKGLVAPDIFLLGFSPLGNLLLFWGALIFVTASAYIVVRGVRAGWFGSLPMRIALAVPLLGGTIKSLALSRFAWVFGKAVDAGMSAQTAIRLGLRSTQNRFYQVHESTVALSVADGKDFFTALSQTDAFPDDLLQAVQTGERTGELTESLDRLSEDYREQSEINLRRIGQLTGFGIFIGVGSLIGFSVLLMYASYLGTLSDALKGQAVTLEQIRDGQPSSNPMIATRNEMLKDFVENNEDFKQIESIYKTLGNYNKMTPHEFLDSLGPDPKQPSKGTGKTATKPKPNDTNAQP